MEVFVTKILDGTNLTNLAKLFSKHGEIQSLKIVTDKLTGELNGVALVKIKSERRDRALSILGDEQLSDYVISPRY